jgi:hypothetical protein
MLLWRLDVARGRQHGFRWDQSATQAAAGVTPPNDNPDVPQ